MILDISFLKLSAMTVLGTAMVVGFYMGRAARLVKLPSLIGYMILGVILGPSLLNVLNESVTEPLSFITEIALGLVAFSIGAELSFSSLRRFGPGIVSIILAGVAIGLSLIIRQDFAQLTAEYNIPRASQIGPSALTTITAPCIFLEIVGPILAKFALTRAGEIPTGKPDA